MILKMKKISKLCFKSISNFMRLFLLLRNWKNKIGNSFISNLFLSFHLLTFLVIVISILHSRHNKRTLTIFETFFALTAPIQNFFEIAEKNWLRIKILKKSSFELLRKLFIMMLTKLNHINTWNSYHFKIIKSMQDSFKVIQPKWTTDKIQNDYHGACNTTEDEES